VKPVAFRYHAPSSVADAVAILEEAGYAGKVLAGGQSLVPMMNFRLARPEVLVDVGRIADLRGIEESAEGLAIGATTTHETLLQAADVAEEWPVMRAAAALIGHWGIRVRGTIGGSVAHADPAAEWPAVLAALGAKAVVNGPGGPREMTVDELVVGPLMTSLEPADVLTKLVVPRRQPGEKAGIYELARRPGDFALVGAVAVQRGHDVTFTWFGLGTRFQSRTVEEFARLDAEEQERRLADLGETLEAESDLHASKAWRQRVAGVVARRAFQAMNEDGGLKAAERSGLSV
jgi:carbon-monoxide dehydrogenase medium subunit